MLIVPILLLFLLFHYSILLKTFVCSNDYLSSKFCVSVTILSTKDTLVNRDKYSHVELTIHGWGSGHSMFHVVLVHFLL